jgi:hypothetical protein
MQPLVNQIASEEIIVEKETLLPLMVDGCTLSDDEINEVQSFLNSSVYKKYEVWLGECADQIVSVAISQLGGSDIPVH